MLKKKRLMPSGHWDWSMPTTFSQGWKVGNLIFVGGQISLSETGEIEGKDDIEVQTRNVFQNIERVLQEAGAGMEDIVKLNTYFTFNGNGEEVREFWEKMTKVRMEFLADPGPAGTAVRVEGFMQDDLLIEVEAIAVVNNR